MHEVAGVDAPAHQRARERDRLRRDAGVDRQRRLGQQRQDVGQVRLGAALERQPDVGVGRSAGTAASTAASTRAASGWRSARSSRATSASAVRAWASSCRVSVPPATCRPYSD